MRKKNPHVEKIFRPIDELTEDEIRALPRAAFSKDEWNFELDDETKEFIYENDPESIFFVNRFVQKFLETRDFCLSGRPDCEEEFERFLAYTGPEELLELYGRSNPFEVNRLIEHFTALGFSKDQVEGAIGRSLQDQNVYSFDYNSDEARPAFFKTQVPQEFFIHERTLSELIDEGWDDQAENWDDRPMFKDEIDRALKEVNQELGTEFTVYDVTHGPIAIDFKTFTVDADPVEDRVEERVEEELEEEDPQGPIKGELPPEERILYRWPDGFYALDLVPKELFGEGRSMGHCVGRPDMGYGKAVRDGEIKIISLRRPNGKPLFTIEADLDHNGEIESCRQIAGKANRYPGFDLGKNNMDGPIKEAEVERLIDLLLVLGISPLNCANNRGHPDMTHALAWIKIHAHEPWAKKMLDKMTISPASIHDLRRNPAPTPPACAAGHGGQCLGFCTPYRR